MLHTHKFNQHTLRNNLWRCHSPSLTGGENGVQRGRVTCPKSHSHVPGTMLSALHRLCHFMLTRILPNNNSILWKRKLRPREMACQVTQRARCRAKIQAHVCLNPNPVPFPCAHRGRKQLTGSEQSGGLEIRLGEK